MLILWALFKYSKLDIWEGEAKIIEYLSEYLKED